MIAKYPIATDALNSLVIGEAVVVVYRHGSTEMRHPAKILERRSSYLSMLVKFTDQPQRKIRWSLITNKPVGESRGLSGSVRLERSLT